MDGTHHIRQPIQLRSHWHRMGARVHAKISRLVEIGEAIPSILCLALFNLSLFENYQSSCVGFESGSSILTYLYQLCRQ